MSYTLRIGLLGGLAACLLLSPTMATLRADVPKLESLSGIMIMRISEDVGMQSRVWCKGDKCRTEMDIGETKIITIQLGNTFYTYGLEGGAGQKVTIAEGLASMSINMQIEKVVKEGSKVGSETLEDGKTYDVYEYITERGRAVAYLAPKTLLPKLWISILYTSKGEQDVKYMAYHEMEANVEIADEMFELPSNVTFVEMRR